MEQQDIHKVINQLNSEERMIIYGIFFENKTQTQMAEIMGISRQMLSYKLKSTLNKMREMYMNKFFKKIFQNLLHLPKLFDFSN
ncbi:MAG: sigma factor-like helix-turn-helix DNA-binding protein [Dorea formicigenerans]